MLGYNRWQIFKGLAASFCILGIVSLALIYFLPSPPSKVVMATSFKGSAVEYYGRQYREIFARSNIELELRETGGAVVGTGDQSRGDNEPEGFGRLQVDDELELGQQYKGR